MGDITCLPLDLFPDFVPLSVACTKGDGTKQNPTVDNLIIYEENGADADEIVAADSIGSFDPVQLPTDAGKTGFWGVNVAKTNFVVGRFYILLWEMTVDAIATHKKETYFFYNSWEISLTAMKGAGFDTGTDSLEQIRNAIAAQAPTTHSANAGNITVGTQIAGTYIKTGIEDEDYWQIQCAAGDDAAGIDVDLTFGIGDGRAAVNVMIRGRIQSANNRDVDVYAWNYDLAAWESLSSGANQMRHSVNDKSYIYALNFNHHQHGIIEHGEVKLRFVGQGTGFTTSHNLYLDQVIIGSVVEGTIQPDVIAMSVWGFAITDYCPEPCASWHINKIESNTDTLLTNLAVVDGKVDTISSNVVDIKTNVDMKISTARDEIITASSNRRNYSTQPL